MRPLDAFADLLDYACDLVTGYDRELGKRESPLKQAQITVTDAAGADPDQDLSQPRRGPLALFDNDLALRLFYGNCFDSVSSRF